MSFNYSQKGKISNYGVESVYFIEKDPIRVTNELKSIIIWPRKFLILIFLSTTYLEMFSGPLLNLNFK